MHWVEELERLRKSHHPRMEENSNVLYIHVLDDLNYIRSLQEDEKKEENDQNRANCPVILL